jgi:hypothetical protein
MTLTLAIILSSLFSPTNGYNGNLFEQVKVQKEDMQHIESFTSTYFNGHDFLYIDALYDFSGTKRYYEIAYEDVGYAIYDTISKEVVEFAENSISPYHSYVNEKKLFIGPIGHFVSIDGAIVDIRTRTQLSTDEIQFLCLKQAQHDRFLLDKKNDGESNHYTTESLLLNNPPVTYSIPRAYYFQNLRKYGSNQLGTCSYIAIQMLLSYYDTFSNDDLISEIYDNPSIIANSQSIPQHTDSPGSLESFHQYLVSFGEEEYGYGLGMYPEEQRTLLQGYLNSRNFISDFSTFYDEDPEPSSYIVNLIKSAIYDGRPVIIDWSGMRLPGEPVSYGNHSVVAFEYINTYVTVNTGWNDLNVVNSSFDYVYGIIDLELSANFPNYLSDNYRLSTGQYVVEGNTHSHRHNTSMHSDYDDYLETTWQNKYLIYSSNYHRLTCWHDGYVFQQHSQNFNPDDNPCICGYYRPPLYLYVSQKEEDFLEVN